MDRKYLAVFAGVALLVLFGITAFIYTQGSLVGSEDWTHVPHAPGQEEHFSSVDQFISEYTEANDDVTEKSLTDNFEFRMATVDGEEIVQYHGEVTSSE